MSATRSLNTRLPHVLPKGMEQAITIPVSNGCYENLDCDQLLEILHVAAAVEPIHDRAVALPKPSLVPRPSIPQLWMVTSPT